MTAESAPDGQDQAPWPRPAYAWYVVGVLTVVFTLSFIDRQVISLLIGPIKADLGISDFEISLLQGFAFAVFYSFMGLPLGRLADHRSRKWIIAIGIFFWSIATAACGLARNFLQLFVARVSVGVGEAALSPSAFSMITDYFPRHKLSRAMSVYAMGIYLGTGLAFVIGGLVVELVMNAGDMVLPLVGTLHPWQVTFIAVGLPGIVFSLLALTLREPKRRGLVLERPDGAGHAAAAIPYRDVLRFMRTRLPLYVGLIGGMSFHAMLGWASVAWIPEFFIRSFDIPRGEVAFNYGLLILICSVPGLLTGGWWADRLEARGVRDAKVRVIIYGSLGVIIPAALFPLMPTYEGAMAVLAVSAFFLAFPYGNAIAALQIITPNEMRGMVSAVYLLVINIIGMGIGASLVAAFTDFVFQDTAKLGWSLAVVGAITMPTSIALVTYSLKHYRAAIDDLDG